MSANAVQILGIRGLPPSHGGFETFVGRLAPYLVDRGLDVTVFCQSEPGEQLRSWKGVRLEHVAAGHGSKGSLWFDTKSAARAVRMPGAALVFGYNTAALHLPWRAFKKRFAVNMDGIEWQRRKWGRFARSWLYVNEIAAARSADILIADHPAIEEHIKRRAGKRTRVRMIPYGADPVRDSSDDAPSVLGLPVDAYGTIIARPEPENLILEMVQAFSTRPRGVNLVVLGKYDPTDPYQGAVLDAASPEVLFPGPIYDPQTVSRLRANSLFYLYGHTVGGTSPTLVEALAAGSVPICLDTVYARWVAGNAGLFFKDTSDLDNQLTQFLSGTSPASRRQARLCSLSRFYEDFTWEKVLTAYHNVVEELLHA